MKFKKLFTSCMSGTPIKRKPWGGYWVGENGRLKIYTKEGEVIDFSEVEDLNFTLSHTFEDDWEVATNENCDIEVR